MAAPIKFLSGRTQQQKIGIEGSTDNQKVLEVVGRVGIGTTIFEPTSKLDVRGDVNVSGVSTFTGDITANGNIVGDNSTNITGIAGVTATTLSGTLQTAAQTNVTSVGTLTGLDVNGHTELDDLNVSGVSTFTGAIDANGSVNATDIIKGYKYTAVPYGSTVTLAVTVASKDSTHRYNGTGSGNGYVIDGIQAPFLTLTPGRTYRFTNDNTGSHPLKFYLEADKTTLYETNVNFQDAYTEITVTDETPIVLHYQCTAHGYMGNAVQTNANVVNTNYPATIRSTLDVSGVSTFTGAIDANGGLDVSGGSGLVANTAKISDLTDNRVVIAGNSGELEDSANLTFDGTKLAINGNLGVTGLTTTQNLNVTGVSTFVGLVTVTTGDVHISNRLFVGGLEVEGSGSENTFTGINTFTNLLDNTLGNPDTGSLNVNGGMGVNKNVSFGSTLFVQNAIGIGSAAPIGKLDVNGHTELDNVNVSGAITATTFTGNLAGTVNTAAQTNITSVGTLSALTVSGDITANGNIAGDNSTNITGIVDVVATTLSGTLQTAAQANVTSVGTLTGLDVNGHTELDNVNVSGISTFAGDVITFTGSSYNAVWDKAGDILRFQDNSKASFGTNDDLRIYSDNSNVYILNTQNNDIIIDQQVADKSIQIKSDDGSGGGALYLKADGSSGELIAYHYGSQKFATKSNGIDVTGHTETDTLNVSGIITTASLNATGKLTTTGIGISIANGAGNTAYIEGPSEIWIDPSPAGAGTTSGSVRIRGDLYVDGTEFIVDVDKIELGDFNIGIASTVSTNSLLDGAGLGIGATSIRKFITWNNATSALMSSENWNLASGKHYEINGTDVLTSDTLGGGVINSSLTSVGTLSALTVSGDITANGNIAGDNSTNITGIAGVTATTLSGTLQTAAQANVTSVGTLSALTVSGDITANGNIAGDNATNITGIAGVTATTLSGTLQTAAQTNVTSVGTLSALTVSGDITANGNIAGDNATNISGINSVTATSFTGNGANVTGILVNNVIGAVEGISIRDEGSLVGTASSVGDINFVSSNLTATASGVGATITFTNTPTFDTVAVTNNITANGNIVGDNSTNITGINQVTATTFSGALSGNATSATTATTATNVTVADESSDTTCFPLFVTAATGDVAPKSGSNLTFNSADGTLTATDFNTTSDENLKDNIRTIEDPLAKVVQIRGVNFDWKENQKPSVGVIAQEVEKVFPELVANGEKKTVNYNGLIGLLIEVVKEQQTQINSLNERLSKIE